MKEVLTKLSESVAHTLDCLQVLLLLLFQENVNSYLLTIFNSIQHHESAVIIIFR